MSPAHAPQSTPSEVTGALCRIAFASLTVSLDDSRERRHAVAKELLAWLGDFGEDGADVIEARWEAGEFGKPRLVGGPEFSFSYSGEWVAVAVSEEPVGIDLEQIRPVRLGDATLVLTPSERDHVGAHPDPDEMQLRIWTRKEAVSKAAGVGMHAPFTEMEAVDAGWVPLAGRSWHVMDVEGPPGTLVSLATTSPSRVRVDFAPLVDRSPGS
jgi:4'-phosphopantetheinyl transferase